MAAILADPATRAQHVDAIANFAAVHNFQGIDIDYEKFAFKDDRSTWATPGPTGWRSSPELGARLHADGRMLTVSVPPIYDTGQSPDSGYWVYDYGGIAPYVDAIRIMAYDYSTDEPGPIAPLAWVRHDHRRRQARPTKAPEKLVLGIPLYGHNWPTSVDGQCPDDAPGARRSTSARSTTWSRGAAPRRCSTCHDRRVDVHLRVDVPEATPTCTQTAQVNYVDAEGPGCGSMSVDGGLRGVSLFAFGYEDDQVWDDIAAISATLTTEPAGSETTTAPPRRLRPPRPRPRPPRRPRPRHVTPTTATLAVTTTTVAA